MGLLDPAAPLLATCGGDTVKLFDVTADSGGDPCVLSYAPTPGAQVNAVKWNHTNLVVASAGDDKMISLWHKKGECIATLHTSQGDDIQESILSVSFSNKGSRYLCSGGTGRIVKIWDLHRRKCIKWLSGHNDTITGVMYNCKDEYLASISVKGDLILHNLASGARAAELSDPSGQVLRVLDYSRVSRHILVTSGDDGSVHLWDVNARVPKVSWLKQHSAPTTGVCFLPTSDKKIASVGLDKKLYTFDASSRRPTSIIPYEAPFSSAVYNDDGTVLAAGTNSGRIVFYDVRGKLEPFTVLRAYNNSEAVTSLCWQRSKPVVVNENSSMDVALLGGITDESVLMPDPLPSVLSSSSTSVSKMRTARSSNTSIIEETPRRSVGVTGGPFQKLALRASDLVKDDMDLFSPLVDVQPSSAGLWNDREGGEVKEEKAFVDNKYVSRFSYVDDGNDTQPTSDWNHTSNFKLAMSDDLGSFPVPGASLKREISTKLTNSQQSSLQRFGSSSSASVSAFSSLQDPFSSSLSTSALSMSHQAKSSFTALETTSAYDQTFVSSSLGLSGVPSSKNLEPEGALQSMLPSRASYADRFVGTSSVFNEGLASMVASPKSKKTGAETREELLNSMLSKKEPSGTSLSGSLSAPNSAELGAQVVSSAGQPNDQQGISSFSLQLVQRTFEESLENVQKSIHEDIRNLHIDLIRQFHMQEMEMARLFGAVIEKQDAMMKEMQALRRENQQLRHQFM